MTSKLNREGNTDQGFSMTFKDRQSGSFQGRISGVEEVVVRSRVTAEAAWCHVAPGPGQPCWWEVYVERKGDTERELFI